MSVILAQTDTTVGLLSRDAQALNTIKQRPPQKPYLKIYYNLHTYKKHARVPNKFKAKVRRSHSISYVVKNEAFRIVASKEHEKILKKYGWLYSTSANKSGQHFQREFCESNADIIVEDYRGLYETVPSKIIKLSKTAKRRLR
ncbi:MAG TPA: Sua5 YciO YrdC YwlC family protein [Helicobacteraceae bacterium]|nr:Sua5 YciO YrdC YwlC family protein [Helicobacteraceae bacterium]